MGTTRITALLANLIFAIAWSGKGVLQAMQVVVALRVTGSSSSDELDDMSGCRVKAAKA